MISNLFFILLGKAIALHHISPAHVELRENQGEKGVMCWDTNFDTKGKAAAGATVFHLHTPKVAGCSVVEDLSAMVGRDHIFTHEACFAASMDANGSSYFKDRVAMVRRPRDHVFSMYEFCDKATDPFYRTIVGSKQKLKGQTNYTLPDSFGKWIDEWYKTPRFGDYSIYEDDEACYCPYNMQAARLACLATDGPGLDCHETVDLDRALKNLDQTTMLGVTEAYHESMCLFHGHLLGSLPDYCNCESPAWASYKETKDTHGEHYNQTIDDMPPDVVQKVDDMTKSDKVIYKAAVQRFIKDVEAMEQRFEVKILCSAQREKLHQKADSA